MSYDGWSFDIVDFEFNMRRAMKACKKVGSRSLTHFDSDELLTSRYPLSLAAEGFAEADYILSRLVAEK